MNEQNLVDLGSRPREERERIASLGGKASAEARRQRRTLREELLLLLESGDTQERMCIALLESALSGSAAAFKQVKEVVEPTKRIELEMLHNPMIGIEEVLALSEEQRKTLTGAMIDGLAGDMLTSEARVKLIEEALE